jgi:hypothetical protein
LRNLVKCRLVVAAALVSGSLLPPVFAAGVACAEEAERAAVVISTGEAVTEYCVDLGADSVSGLELIILAGEQHGLSYKLGFGEQAVCMLAGIGPTSENCFEEYPDFWGYWRGDGSGGWEWSSTGAASTTVEGGDVEGWAWGSGDGADSHPRPPDTEFASVCEVNPTPTPTPSSEPESGDDPEASPAPSPSNSVDSPRTDRNRRDRRQRDTDKVVPDESRDRRWHDGELAAAAQPDVALTPAPALSPEPSPSELAAQPLSDSGPPPAGLAAVLATAALAAAGAVVVRRRS